MILAIGFTGDSVYSSAVSTTATPQEIAEALQYDHGMWPDWHMLVSNGKDHPVIIGTYDVMKDEELSEELQRIKNGWLDTMLF